jgi:Bacterial regulatory proteins, luxR family
LIDGQAAFRDEFVALSRQGASCCVKGLRAEIEDQDTHDTFDAQRYTTGTADFEELAGKLAGEPTLMARCRDADGRRGQARKLARRPAGGESLARGRTNKQVAAALKISVKTVNVYRANIMWKLMLPNFSDLICNSAQSDRHLNTEYPAEAPVASSTSHSRKYRTPYPTT